MNYSKAMGQAESLLNNVARTLLEDRHYEEARLAITAIEAIDELHNAVHAAQIEERSLMRADLEGSGIEVVEHRYADAETGEPIAERDNIKAAVRTLADLPMAKPQAE